MGEQRFVSTCGLCFASLRLLQLRRSQSLPGAIGRIGLPILLPALPRFAWEREMLLQKSSPDVLLSPLLHLSKRLQKANLFSVLCINAVVSLKSQSSHTCVCRFFATHAENNSRRKCFSEIVVWTKFLRILIFWMDSNLTKWIIVIYLGWQM